MKNLFKRLLVILFIELMLINSSLLSIISVAADEVQKLIDKSNVKLTYSMNLEKYVNYSLSDQNKGLLVQLNLKTLTEYEEENITNATGIVLNLPKINDEYPENVEVLSNSDENIQAEYDKEKGILQVLELEKDKCEYTIVISYSQNCYTAEEISRTLKFNGKVLVQLADEEKETIASDINESYDVNKNISNLISTSLETTDIYNGFITSNRENGTKYATDYTENLNIDIGYKEIADEVRVKLNNEFLSGDEFVDTNEIIFKSTKINKNDVLAKLGEEGNFKILNSNGDVLGEINKDTEAQEDGTVEFKYENEISELEVVMTKPVQLGKLNIQNNKQIKDTVVNIEDNKIIENHLIQGINSVEKINNENTEINKEEIYKFENNYVTEIKNSETRVDLSINKTEWTNNTQNDVTLIATLVTSSAQNSLFKNPVLEIELPSEVEKVILGDINLLYDENLSIKNAVVIDKNNSKVIRIELNGIQSEYISNSMINGANIIIPATVIVKKDIDSVETAINMTYLNENESTNDYKQNGHESKQYSIKINSINSNIMTVTNSQEETQGESVNLTDGLAVELNAKVGEDTLNSGDIVYEDEVIEYEIKITNNTENTINNIKIEGNVPEGTIYVTKDGSEVNPDRDESEDEIRNELYIKNAEKKQEIFEIQSLSSGESVVKKYKVMVDDLGENTQGQINSEFNIYTNNQMILNKTMEFVSKDSKLRIGLYPYKYQTDIGVRYNWSFLMEVENKTNAVAKNSTVEIRLSEELNFVYCSDSDYQVDFDQNTRILKINMGDLEKNSKEKFALILSATNFSEGKYEYIIPVNAKVYAENTDVYRTDTEEVTAYYSSMSIVKESPTEGQKLKCFEEVEYTITVTNEGLLDEYVTIIDNMPEFISAKSAEYESYNYNNETGEYEKVTKTKDLTKKLSSETNDFELNTVILKGESLKIKIFAKVEPTDKVTEVENTAMVYGMWIKTKTSNIIKNTIMPYGYEEPDNPDKPDTPDNPDKPNIPDTPDNPDIQEEYSINGVVWLDENKDGKRDEDEELLSGITVKLFDANTNSIVTDDDNNPMKIETDENGKYEFKKIAKGKYLVLFEYDTKTYEITAYQKNGINAYLNSDVIKKEVSIDGDTKEVGITDILTITNSNLKNIDMGLIKNPVLDFKLDKYVDKITISNSSGTKEYEYNNSQLAKVEIPAKQINNTEVKIEYKIVVTNEGEVEGYVNEIIDYLPSGLLFSTEDNKGWSQNKEGSLINDDLSTEKINPGESKEVTLILTKNMTENSTGTIINAAEIGKTTNSKDVLDIDSTEANKSEIEDDYSEAKVIVSIKTGTIMYCGLILISLLVIAFVIYVMKKKDVNKVIINLVVLGIVVGVVITLFTRVSLMYTDGEEQVIKLSQLKEHVVDGTWVSTGREGAIYWCVNPSRHLGEGCDTYYYDADGSGYLDKIDGGEGSVVWYTNAIGLPYNGTLQEFAENTFNNIGSTPSVNISGIDNTNAKIKEKTSSYTIVGPYTLNYTFENCSTIKLSLDKCTVDGSAVDGAYICDSNGTEIDTCSNGGEIYIKVPKAKVPSLQITLKLQTEEVKTGAKLVIGAWKIRNCTAKKTTHQSLITVDSEEIRNSGSATADSDTKLTGSLKIVKKDSDSGNEISGAKFKITGPDNYSEEVTMNDGNITVEDLIPGEYTVTEIGTPNGYTLNLQENTSQKIEIKAGDTLDLTFYNRKYGNIVIKKVDAASQKSELEDLKFNNVGFKIYIDDSGTNKYIKNYKEKEGKASELEFTTNKNEAKEFKTDDNGEIKLENIPQIYKYYIEEVSLPNAMAQYYDVKGTVDATKINNDGDTAEAKINNVQKRVDIQGYVWEDIATGKTTTRDDLYANENNTKDKRVKNIPVYLKKNGTVIAERVTNSNGEYFFAASGKYNSDGTGKDYTIVIDELKSYLVEFEYNGLKYQSVLTNSVIQKQENSSKAAETDANRTNLNNNYHTIVGGNSKTSTGTQGNTDKNVKLKYTNGDSYSSELVQNTSYTANSLNGRVSPTDSAKMLADTGTAGYELKWTKGVRRIKNINLGIYEREQPDMAIATDIDNIQFSINGYTHTYNYKQRGDYIKDGVPDKDINPGYDATMDGFNVSVKNVRTGNYKDMTYTRAVYDSYIAYTKKYPNSENKLRVFVTYKLVVKNESSGLVSRVSLKNYADQRYYRVDESYYIDNNNRKVAVEWKQTQNNSGIWQTEEIQKDINPTECVAIYLKYELNTDTIVALANLGNGQDITLNKNVTEIISYSTWKDKKAYGGVDKDSAPGNITYNNVSTYEDDTDSAPDLKIERKSSKEISGIVFEDVTNSDLKTGNVREGNKIYEENKDKTVKDVNVQFLDYNNKNIVKLYNLDSNGNAVESEAQAYTNDKGEYDFVGIIPGQYYIQYIYGSYKDDDGNAKQSVIKSGTSEIEVTTQNYKSTIVDSSKFKTLIDNNIENENGYATIKADFEAKKNGDALWYWYEKSENSANSSAVDKSDWRTMINQHLKDIDYNVKDTYENKSDIAQDATNAKYYYMIANTGIMDFAVEDYQNQSTENGYDFDNNKTQQANKQKRDYQIKFGIAERPRQSLQVNKEISKLCLTLANGQVLAQGDPRNETIRYVTYPDGGTLKIEADNEIIEGATLDLEYEITIENRSELDYDALKYYRYGDTTGLSPVKIKLNSIADYVDEKLSITYDIDNQDSDFVYYNQSTIVKNKWQIIKNAEGDNKLAGIPIDSKVYNATKNRSNIVVRNTDIEISPLDSKPAVLTLSAKKLLTNLNEDQEFNNYTELIKVSNSVGRFYGQMKTNEFKLETPGNFNIKDIANTDESDNSNYSRWNVWKKNNAQVVIVPPTGAQNIVIYVIIGLGCLIILSGGIILIKKKVLD